MAIPYSTTIAGTNVLHLVNTFVSNTIMTWKYVEDVNIKDGGTWEDVKEVHVKSWWHVASCS